MSRWLCLLCVLPLLLSACTVLPIAPLAPAVPDEQPATTPCAVTQPVQDEPPDDPNADPFGFGDWYINADRTIWVGLPPTGAWRAGGEKVMWIRPAGTDLSVTGHRLDAEAPPLRADIPCCYLTGFQVSGLIFPAEGCWEVTATAGEHELRFVTRIVPSDEDMVSGPCPSLADAVRLSDAVVVGRVTGSEVSGRYAWQTVTVQQTWKLPPGWSGIGDWFSLLQDLQAEPELAAGKRYVLFLQDAPWRLVCAQGSLFEAEATTATPRGADPLWSGGTLNELKQEIDRLATAQVGSLLALHMQERRAAHTATLLNDGRVLLAGGFQEESGGEIPIAGAELYDPRTNTFRKTGALNEPRTGHTATLLPDGRVLLVGGWSTHGRTASAELYDPQTGEFTYTAGLASPRAGMTATLLKNGNVLIAGGERARNTPQLAAELYDPQTGVFMLAGVLHQGRSAHTATLLDDGRVLLAGGSPGADQVLDSAELYDPATEGFTLTGVMTSLRYKHAAVLLPDGDVLLVGGSDARDWRGRYASAEVYDVHASQFARLTDMSVARFKLPDAVAVLASGQALIAGGNRQLELFDLARRQFRPVARLDDNYYFATATRLVDGRVLIAGGYNDAIAATDKAWIY